MDCRTFRNQHLGFVDDTLPGVVIVTMRRHLMECESCARLDTRVRKSLLIARNMSPVEPSRDFAARLALRIEREKIAMRAREFASQATQGARGPTVWTFVSVAASLVGIGYLAAVALDWTAPPRDIALAPVVATQPLRQTFPSQPLGDPALVASLSAGIPVWPVAYFVGQVPVRLAEMTR